MQENELGHYWKKTPADKAIVQKTFILRTSLCKSHYETCITFTKHAYNNKANNKFIKVQLWRLRTTHVWGFRDCLQRVSHNVWVVEW